ncbi:putative GspD-related protein, partial [Burkholderia sp. H160]
APAQATAPPPAFPPANVVMPSGDMPSDNPLHPIQNGGY